MKAVILRGSVKVNYEKLGPKLSAKLTIEASTVVPITHSSVSWCFKPSQPQRIVSGQKETFIERYIVGRTNKAGIRPEEQSKKAEIFRENLWHEVQLKGP